MGMLDRYKKKGGFIQLLNLLETSSKAKQEQFLTLISQENVNWEMELKQRVLTVEKIVEWPKEQLTEIISRVQPLTLAVALRKFEAPKREEILSILSQSEKRKILSIIDETNPTPAEVATCLSKIVTEVRGLIQQGTIKLEKFNPDLAIPENIEEMINNKSQGLSFDEPSKSSSSSSSSSSSDENPPEVELDFSGGKNRNQGAGGEKLEAMKEEIDMLKKKINHLTQESTTLKVENSVLRNKLEQIKKIA